MLQIVQVYEVAYSYPYPYTHLQHVLHELENPLEHSSCTHRSHFFRRVLLCRTPQLRRVDLLVISDPMVDLPAPWSPDYFTAHLHHNELNCRVPYVDLLSRCRYDFCGKWLNSQCSHVLWAVPIRRSGVSCIPPELHTEQREHGTSKALSI
jgi:hypothetical protein